MSGLADTQFHVIAPSSAAVNNRSSPVPPPLHTGFAINSRSFTPAPIFSLCGKKCKWKKKNWKNIRSTQTLGPCKRIPPNPVERVLKQKRKSAAKLKNCIFPLLRRDSRSLYFYFYDRNTRTTRVCVPLTEKVHRKTDSNRKIWGDPEH